MLLTACAGTNEKVAPQKTTDATDVEKYNALVEDAIPSILEILNNDLSDKLKYEKIKAELPDLEAFDSLHEKLCAKYINGEITYEQYFGFTNTIFPVYRKTSEGRQFDKVEL
jgi:hypothetical protein